MQSGKELQNDEQLATEHHGIDTNFATSSGPADRVLDPLAPDTYRDDPRCYLGEGRDSKQGSWGSDIQLGRKSVDYGPADHCPLLTSLDGETNVRKPGGELYAYGDAIRHVFARDAEHNGDNRQRSTIPGNLSSSLVHLVPCGERPVFPTGFLGLGDQCR